MPVVMGSPTPKPTILSLGTGRRPDLGPGSWVAPGVVIVGDVTLEPGASVWYGAVLRGDNDRIEVGGGANIQDNCVLHADEGFPLHVGSDVTVGHGAVLHGCRIEPTCLIGLGAHVMNGVIVGTESIVAAGALLPPGLQVPARSMVAGVPARVRRRVTDEEVTMIRTNAADYRELARAHATATDGSRNPGTDVIT